MLETVEHNNRFYGEELKTESEQLKEWLVVANKHNEELQKERDMYKVSFEEMSKNYFESQNKIERLNNIIEEVREWAKKCSCQFTNDDGELVVSEISFNIQARPCDLFKILDKEVNKE